MSNQLVIDDRKFWRPTHYLIGVLDCSPMLLITHRLPNDSRSDYSLITHTLQLENDRQTVETSLLFNFNFYREIRYK